MSEFAIQIPKYSWKCELSKDVFFCMEEGRQPNAFHRFMQTLCFGVKWSKISE